MAEEDMLRRPRIDWDKSREMMTAEKYNHHNHWPVACLLTDDLRSTAAAVPWWVNKPMERKNRSQFEQVNEVEAVGWLVSVACLLLPLFVTEANQV